jgi:hypothetical protein
MRNKVLPTTMATTSSYMTYDEFLPAIARIIKLCGKDYTGQTGKTFVELHRDSIYCMNEEDANAAMEELNSYLEKMRHLWMVENDPGRRSTGGTVTFYDDVIRMTLSTIRARFPYKRSM